MVYSPNRVFNDAVHEVHLVTGSCFNDVCTGCRCMQTQSDCCVLPVVERWLFVVTARTVMCASTMSWATNELPSKARHHDGHLPGCDTRQSMLVKPDAYETLYETILREQASTLERNVVIFSATTSCDAVCATKILMVCSRCISMCAVRSTLRLLSGHSQA